MTLFRRSDFGLYYTLFQEVWESGDVYADPSGWRDTEAHAADILPTIRINKRALGRYYLDEGDTLGPLKAHILRLIGFWEDRPVGDDEVTLYNSVSTGTAAVLIALRRLGVRTIVFETPAYGVTINQARHSGYRIELAPTYFRDGFAARLERPAAAKAGGTAYWLTQPRMSLGIDQEVSAVSELLDGLGTDDYLVIDEATEQRCPSLLRALAGAANSERLLRIRGVLKPLGLNGLRLACVIHHESRRESLENTQDVTGASLDLYSLEAGAEMGRRPEQFFSMLSAANRQVTELRKKVELLTSGTGVVVSHLVNGYMGAAFVPLRGGRRKYRQNKEALLGHCLSHRMPIILGASMYFAFDPEWEQVRLNYFNRERNILRAAEVLSAFRRGAGEQREEHPADTLHERRTEVKP
jgi:histidinol-phosphate/aromatic aminotransferase/cobyric acid decarboxylase-like protein